MTPAKPETPASELDDAIESLKSQAGHSMVALSPEEAAAILRALPASPSAQPQAWLCVDLVQGGHDITEDREQAEWRARLTQIGGKPAWDVKPLGFLSPRAEEAARSGVEGWQPIETGPHSGIAVLLFQPWKSGYDTVFIGHYANGWVAKDWTEYDGMREVQPTHWQPIPAAPEAMRVKEGKNGN